VTALVKPPPALKKRLLSANQLKQSNFALGSRGETRAVEFLKHKKYQILDTNVRIRNVEIDIIALDSELDELVFIEVKTRSQPFYGDPSHAVDYFKLKSMQSVAAAFRRERHLDKDYRFDIISILPGEIEHFENVTWNRRN
jgi:putative endonuclease